MRKLAALGLLCVLLVGLTAVAGENPYAGKIAKYVWVEQDQVAIGKEVVFTKVVKQFRDAAASTNANVHWIAGTPIAGDGTQALFVTFHESYASIEDTMAAFEKVGREITVKNANFAGEIAESERSSHFFLQEFRPDLSLKPDKVDPALAKRWQITTFRLKPGAGTTFTDLVKEVIELHKKANDNAYWIAYQTLAGAPGPSFTFVTPLRSLADLDQDDSAAMKALLTTVVRRQLDATVKETVASIETTIYAARPELSHPTSQMVAANPDFWTVKEPAPAVTAKKGKKGVQPAAMKEPEQKK